MFAEFLLFAGKALVIVLMFASFVLMIAMAVARAQHSQELEVEPLHTRMKDLGHFLRSFRLNKEEAKAEAKAEKKKAKQEKKSGDEQKKNVLFVLRFDGDIRASQVENLREEVTAILQASTKTDEVLCVLESPGGVVNGYGLAASQLLRIRDAGLKLTVAVDEVAASGGYLMSCVAHEIIAAPFAIVGSIGVVAQVPNFNKLLKKHDVEYHEYTAGEFKRTVSLFGEITPKGEEKFLQQLEETHVHFKDFVGRYRPKLNMSQIATGEYWYGEKALQLGLVDKIQTSDDYVLEKIKEDLRVLEIHYSKPQGFQERLTGLFGMAAEKTLLKIWTQLEKQKFFS